MTVIVDRGMSMSAMRAGVSRFHVAAMELAGFLDAHHVSPSSIDIVEVPGGEERTDTTKLRHAISSLTPTALDTGDLLRAAVRDQLARHGGPVVVLSDQVLGTTDDRLIQLVPPSAAENVAITRLAARMSPAAQVMLRLRNDSARQRAAVRVTSGSSRADQTVDLPPNGAEQNYFISLPKLGSDVAAELLEHDDQPADDRAWLVCEGNHPRLEVRSPISPELRRMAEAYALRRPPGATSPAVAIVGNESQLSAQPSVVVTHGTSLISSQGEKRIASHPVTAEVNWNSLPADVHYAGSPPAGWTPLVSVAGQTLVAARSGPARQVWIGFDSSAWSHTSDFVIFWANVFDWLGNEQETYAAHPLDSFEPDWKLLTIPAISPSPTAGQWSGLYELPDGRHIALNAPADPIKLAGTSDWRNALVRWLTADVTARLPLQMPLLLICLACLALAAWTWDHSNAATHKATDPCNLLSPRRASGSS
jgi:hypothetical protein